MARQYQSFKIIEYKNGKEYRLFMIAPIDIYLGLSVEEVGKILHQTCEVMSALNPDANYVYEFSHMSAEDETLLYEMGRWRSEK